MPGRWLKRRWRETNPRKSNPHRYISKKYDVEEGYTILRSAKLVNNEYKLYIELVRPYHAFTESGRQELIHGVSKLVKEDTPLKITIYTCGAYIFLSGCLSKQLFLLDAQPIRPELGRNGNGILKVYPTCDSASQYQLCAWIWKRIQISGVQVKAMQSLDVQRKYKVRSDNFLSFPAKIEFLQLTLSQVITGFELTSEFCIFQRPEWTSLEKITSRFRWSSVSNSPEKTRTGTFVTNYARF